MAMLLSRFVRDMEVELQTLYPEREAREITLRLCEDFLGVSRFAHILDPQQTIPADRLAGLEDCAARLLKAEPLQYVTGCAHFYGRRFKVSPAVLIPRPETEELVRLGLEALPAGGRVLDLCTGSGCIAWTVKLECPHSEVVAVDISSEALETAEGQFEGPAPRFIKADVREPLPLEGEFDLLLSNPPYVLESEKASMRPNVLEYEPGLALFVPDSDPLLFYRALADRSIELLRPSGEAFMEINENFALPLVELFESRGFIEVGIVRDFAGKQRILHIRKPAPGTAYTE